MESRRIGGTWTGAIVGAIAWAALATPALAQSIQNRVEQMLSNPALRSSQTGVIILDAETGQTLAEQRADDLFIPASNMKLLTSGVALLGLGEDFVFRTELVLDRSFTAPDGTPNRVILRGSGDPALADPELLEAMNLSAHDIVDAWAGALVNAGVTGRVGELVIDDRIFDRQYVHPSWPVQQLNRWYCAEVAGMNFHANLLLIYTEPQAPGTPPRFQTEPKAPWIQIRNRAKSVSRGNHTAWAARVLDGNDITLQGDVRWATDPVELALHDNPTFTGRLLSAAMAKAGVAPRSIRLAGIDEPLPAGQVVHQVTTDIQTVLRRCNVNSYNLYAECLLKRLGHEMTQQPGSWAGGAAFMRMMMLEKVGPLAGQVLTVADGSGMSRENRVSPHLVAQWLRALLEEPERDLFLESLPSANTGEGTLAKRFRDTPLRNEVRAKTGYLTGVSALSGYVLDPQSERGVIFSILTNEKPNNVRLSVVRNLEERIVDLADQWLADRAALSIGQAGE